MGPGLTWRPTAAIATTAECTASDQPRTVVQAITTKS